MTGPEHYAEAEGLLDAYDAPSPHVVAIAQVHATLALAAATALVPSNHSVNAPDTKAWAEAAS